MATIEERHWWFVGKRDLVLRLLRRHGGLPSRPTILDAGCGTGQTVADLRGLGTVFGADYDAQAVRFTRQRGFRCVVQADCRFPPFGPEQFDVVVLLDTLEHVPDDVLALRRLAEVLKPDGRLVVTVPAHPWLFGSHDRALGHVRRYTRGRLRRVAGRAGLRVCHLTGYNTLLLPVVVAWRVLGRLVRPHAEQSDVNVDIPGWANRLLTGLMHLENRFNCRAPLGPSLTLVAVLTRDE